MRPTAPDPSAPTIAAGSQLPAISRARARPVVNPRSDPGPRQFEPGPSAFDRDPVSTEPAIKPAKGVIGLNRGLQHLELLLAEAGVTGTAPVPPSDPPGDPA